MFAEYFISYPDSYLVLDPTSQSKIHKGEMSFLFVTFCLCGLERVI